MELREGAVVAGRYRLVRPLGEGGMGAVWLAQHVSLDSTCAIKFIHDEAADRPEARARFDREAKASAQLRSENVVQILDYGIEDGTPYLAMEHLVGEPLSDRLKRLGRLSPNETYRVISGVARALSKAHGAGIVHRDLKPDNIFLCREEDRDIPKVLDFGIAKHQGLEINGSSTRTGALLGTPFYMSPEQAQGIKSVDGRADLWSLAVVTYRCMTGELPFRSEALGDLLMKIMTFPIPIPSHVARGIPEGFDRWFERAMQRDPDRRFQSARAFSEALGLALGASQPNLGATPMPDAMSRAGAAAPPVLAQTRMGTANGLGLVPDQALPFPGAPGAQGAAGARPGAPGATPGGAYPGYAPQPAQGLAAAQTYGGQQVAPRPHYPSAPAAPPYGAPPQPVAPDVYAPGGTAYAAVSPFNSPEAVAAYTTANGTRRSPAAGGPGFDQTSSGLRPAPELAGAHALGGPSMSGLEAPARPARPVKGKGPLIAVLVVAGLAAGGVGVFFATRGPATPSNATGGSSAGEDTVPAASSTAAPAATASTSASATATQTTASASATAATSAPEATASASASNESSSGPSGSSTGSRTTGRKDPVVSNSKPNTSDPPPTTVAPPPPPPPPPPANTDTLGF